MNTADVKKILSDTAYIKTSGSAEELACAQYIVKKCEELGLQARMESFAVKMYAVQSACLRIGGREFPCQVYHGCGNGSVKAKLYYLADLSSQSLKKCRDRIVLLDKGISYKLYDMIVAHGAVGVIAACGAMGDAERAIDWREIRFTTETGECLPCVNIHIRDVLRLVKEGAKEAEITVQHTSYMGKSHNVILDMDGECDETVVISAHYDSTSLSIGAYDNMSSVIGLLYLAEWLSHVKLHRRVRLLWCGSEERGLLGSFAYCRGHADELKNTVLNINLDMLGCALGNFVAFNCVGDGMQDLLTKFLAKHRFAGTVRYDIRSSDSNSFLYHGVPAVSFARYFPTSPMPIHTSRDTAEVLCGRRLLADMRLIAKFVAYAADGDFLPGEISEKIATAVAAYFERRTMLLEANDAAYDIT